MSGYFSFHKMITVSFVKVIYFLGFLALTIGCTSLVVWAGLRLQDATIDRQLGWRYVAIGTAGVLIGNLVWRVLCESWIVLFNIHSHLASIDDSLGISTFQPQTTVRVIEREESAVEEQSESSAATNKPSRETYQAGRPASVLGL